MILEQSVPPTILSHFLDFQVVGSNCDQIQGSHITQVEEQESEDAISLSSFSKNPPCEDDALPFLDDFQSANLSRESNEINSFNQSIALGNNHSDDDEFVDECDHKSLGASTRLLVSREDFNLEP